MKYLSDRDKIQWIHNSHYSKLFSWENSTDKKWESEEILSSPTNQLLKCKQNGGKF